MTLYLLWGLIFAISYHLFNIFSDQEIKLSEILLVTFFWPIFVIMFIWLIVFNIFN